ncbi:MAG TPA: damage-inducible protein CinA [Rhodospirillaceae bacterium]|nr:damage-inducible protein CinA [Rhodospirillaceae bacterium]HAA93720.1 damage-inducible protein CinA [Rhodospirillaceae bacterium]HAT34224.1 damage-inducible protein CinA [Rhodospirillaceae bacterium]
MFDTDLTVRAAEFLDLCRSKSLTVGTAESCTGGLISALLTSISGSSDVFDRGFATYSNEAKVSCLGVKMELIEKHGAVSQEVAMAMAKGTLAHSNATLSVSVTGIAGPGGGTAEKPVGLVFIGSALEGSQPIAEKHLFPGDRDEVRRLSVEAALALLFSQAQTC